MTHYEKTSTATVQPKTETRPRIPRADAIEVRTPGPESSSTQRPLATHSRLVVVPVRARERLRLSKQFLAMFRRGVWLRRREWSIGVLPNYLTINRLGIRIPKGAGTAVERNRAKRLIREAYRRIQPELKPGHDLVIIAQRIAGRSLPTLQHELRELCRQADPES